MKPTSLRYRVLRLVVQNPGDLTAEQLAHHIFPPPKLAGPLTSRAAWNARALAVEQHQFLSRVRVSNALASLTAQGYLAPCGAPVVAAWFAETIERRGLTGALKRAHPAWPAKLPSLRVHLALLSECRKGPQSVTDLLGANPSGTIKRAYRDLADWACIVSPSRRVPTWKGTAQIDGSVAA